MLKIFNMEECKPVCTPMITGCKLRKDDEADKVDQKIYRSLIGTLLYLTSSRPDIMQVVGCISIFQDVPKEMHVQAVKIIFRYLKRDLDFCLWYLCNSQLSL